MPTRSGTASQPDHLVPLSARPRSRPGVSGADEDRVAEAGRLMRGGACDISSGPGSRAARCTDRNGSPVIGHVPGELDAAIRVGRAARSAP
jgi:hypothetical protein